MIVHLNGNHVPRERAAVSVFDRGLLFGEGVYEGLRADGGAVIGMERHVERLREGMAAAGLDGFDAGDLPRLTADLLEANGLHDAFVYWQVTGGAPNAGDPVRERLPARGRPPTVFGYAERVRPASAWTEPRTTTAALVEDRRWALGLIKSTSLLGNVIAAREASARGAHDAIFVRDGLVAEATASNIFVRVGGRFATPDLRRTPILAGVTRALLIEADPSIEVRAIPAEELRHAESVLLVGTRSMVTEVTALDGAPVGDRRGPSEGGAALLATLLGAIAREKACSI